MLSDAFHTNRYAVLDTLILTTEPFTRSGIRAHGRCDRFTGDAYSSKALVPTSGVSRGLGFVYFLISISYRTYKINDCSLFMPFDWDVTITSEGLSILKSLSQWICVLKATTRHP
jgi:hypothetical protein